MQYDIQSFPFSSSLWLKRFNAVFALVITNKRRSASNLFRNFSLAEFFRNFAEPFYVSKLWKRDPRKLTRNDFADAEIVKTMPKVLIGTVNFSGYFASRDALSNLFPEPFRVIVLGIICIGMAVVFTAMLSRCADFYVFWSIVLFVAVYMVDSFARKQRPSEFLFGNKPMHEDITVFGVGMVRLSNAEITHSNSLASLPSWMIFPSKPFGCKT